MVADLGHGIVTGDDAKEILSFHRVWFYNERTEALNWPITASEIKLRVLEDSSK